MNRLIIFLATLTAASAAPASYDVVVYGGTSGGVAAAVQVARSGKSVVLITTRPQLGGLTSSGLGWTDLGRSSILGGISREFYQRVYQHYADDAAWDKQTRGSFGNSGQGGPAFNHTTEIASVFEPKVARAVFDGFISDENIPVITGRLDLLDGVVMEDDRISRLKLEDGRQFAGKMFIDASYEGDLLPGARVTFTVGREANATYGETVSGIQVGNATKNQLVNNIDPYVVQGEPASGLLPGVEPDAGGPDGTADHRLQAYCYRMVLTDVPDNRVPIAQPEGYDEADYELLFRSIEAGQTSGFFKLDLMPNRKTDSNNTGGISTDYIGMNYGDDWDWSTLGHDDREALAKKHENWQRGLVWTLQNHSRVPQTIRNGLAKWGLPADEFTDNNHWPYELYVREARRMISDYVMHQQHCSGVVAATDSIGLAAYTMDSHNVQRHVRNGMVKNEGDVQHPVPNPYPISYRSIVPRQGECANLLVPWSLSASHMAFGSIRMEPVFMILSQSAAIAATMAIDQDIDVQDISYPALRAALLAAGQELGDSVAAPPAVIIDNDHQSLVTLTGEWLASSATTGFAGADYHHNNNAGQGAKEVVYRFPPGTQGVHRIYLRWTSHANRASNIPVDIRHAEGVATVTVNQRENGGQWNALGIHRFEGGADEGLVIRTDATNGFVIADAVGISPVGPDDDTDGDGLSDLRELLLGLDPLVSNAVLIEGVKEHPHFFGLHHPEEIHDLAVTRPTMTSSGGPGLGLGVHFAIIGSDNGTGADPIESFALAVDPSGARKFFRLAIPLH